MPEWLTLIAWISLILAFACALLIAADIAGGRRQRMRIMNLVWPITALYAGPLALWGYCKVGRASPNAGSQDERGTTGSRAGGQQTFLRSTALATTHCGSGCTLGDIVAEWALVAIPLTLFGHAIFAGWVADYILAFGFGIAFQYFTIKPMRDIGAGAALLDALKADTLSLTAWQVGMYGWMAIVTFAIFGHELDKTGPVFWFMMQIAMLAGFCTAFPVNAWLLKAGIKEPM